MLKRTRKEFNRHEIESFISQAKKASDYKTMISSLGKALTAINETFIKLSESSEDDTVVLNSANEYTDTQINIINDELNDINNELTDINSDIDDLDDIITNLTIDDLAASPVHFEIDIDGSQNLTDSLAQLTLGSTVTPNGEGISESSDAIVIGELVRQGMYLIIVEIPLTTSGAVTATTTVEAELRDEDGAAIIGTKRFTVIKETSGSNGFITITWVMDLLNSEGIEVWARKVTGFGHDIVTVTGGKIRLIKLSKII